MRFNCSIAKVIAVAFSAWFWLSISASEAADYPTNTQSNSDSSYTRKRWAVKPFNITATTVSELCQKYHHCKKPPNSDPTHQEELVEFLGQKIADKTFGVEQTSTKTETEITALRVDFRKLFTSRSYWEFSHGCWPNHSSEYLASDQWMLLAFCKNYHHCQSTKADTLHCYELESHLLKLKSEKQQELLSATTDKEKATLKAEIARLENDLEKLKNFGKPRDTDRSYSRENGSQNASQVE